MLCKHTLHICIHIHTHVYYASKNNIHVYTHVTIHLTMLFMLKCCESTKFYHEINIFVL